MSSAEVASQDADCTPPRKGLHAPYGPIRRCHGRQARCTSRCHGLCSAHSTRSLRGHHPASAERPALLSTGGRTISQAAHSHAHRRRTSGLYAFHRSATRAHLPLPRLVICTRAASPLPRSSPVASPGTTHTQHPRRWARRGRSLGHPCLWRMGIYRNSRLAALRGVGSGRLAAATARLLAAAAVRCPRDVSPRATCSIAPRRGPAQGPTADATVAKFAPSVRAQSAARTARPVLGHVSSMGPCER